MQLPDTVAALLKADVLDAVVDALAPTDRAAVTFAIEVEVQRQGTFTLTYKDGRLSGKKGFAGDPLLSATLDAGAWKLIVDELQAAVDGFPSAPILKARLETSKGLSAKSAAEVLAAVAKLAEGLCIHFDIRGEGKISVCRGPVDEAARELTILVDGAQVRSLLTGAALTGLKVSMSGDRSVGASVATAMAPVMALMKA